MSPTCSDIKDTQHEPGKVKDKEKDVGSSQTGTSGIASILVRKGKQFLKMSMTRTGQATKRNSFLKFLIIVDSEISMP